jgi:hypothetical protein
MCRPITKTGGTQTVMILTEGSQHKWITNCCKEKCGSGQCERSGGPNHGVQPGGFNADKDTGKNPLIKTQGFLLLIYVGYYSMLQSNGIIFR